VIFGVFNALPIKYMIQPIICQEGMEAAHFAGLPQNMILVAITITVLIASVLNHIYGVRKSGKPIGAVDHIYHAPVLSFIYDRAEKGRFDPYNLGIFLADIFARIAAACDKAIDWFYNILTPRLATIVSENLRWLHNGSYRTYIGWAFAAAAAIVYMMIRCPQY
jgi:hypothetical protein